MKTNVVMRVRKDQVVVAFYCSVACAESEPNGDRYEAPFGGFHCPADPDECECGASLPAETLQ